MSSGLRVGSGLALAATSVIFTIMLYTWLPSVVSPGERLFVSAYVALPGIWGGAALMGGSARALWGTHAHESWLPLLLWVVLASRRCLPVMGYPLSPFVESTLTGIVLLLVVGCVWSWANARMERRQQA